MHVAACIVAYSNVDDVRRCVAALAMTNHDDLSVTICENGGPKAFEKLLCALPATLPGGGAVVVIDAGANLGYAGGFNRCVAATPDADAWWLVNPDAEAEPEALGHMLKLLANGEADAVGGTLCLTGGRVQGHGGRFRPWLARAESIGHGSLVTDAVDRADVEREMNYILGASILAGRHFMAVAGPMREDYFLYAEEVEWGLRAVAKGLKLGFAPAARVWHNQGSTTGSARTIAHRPWLPVYLDERNRLHVVRDTRPWLLPAAAMAAIPLILLRYARRGAWTQSRYALSGWWAGLRNERGVPPGHAPNLSGKERGGTQENRI
jgi:N-acetylglucosaminyl-diphospho-decaprenol L-rhamnosyltransferase